MRTLSNYIVEEYKNILEKALNLGNKSATPAFNQVIILAGGAGSGKGTVLNGILDVSNAKVFDPDAIKTKLVKTASQKLDSEFMNFQKQEIANGNEMLSGLIEPVSFKDFSFTNSAHVSALHLFVKNKKYDTKSIEMVLNANKNSSNKPNLVFDGTLKEMKKLIDISTLVQQYGYDKKNIHLVWVLNDFEIASVQNTTRSRQVSDEIMRKTHIGCSNTMKELLQNFAAYAKYINGDIYIVPNSRNKDNVFCVLDSNIKGKENKQEMKVLLKYTKIQCKEAGKPIKSFDEIMDTEYAYDSKTHTLTTFRELINSYIPNKAEKY